MTIIKSFLAAFALLLFIAGGNTFAQDIENYDDDGGSRVFIFGGMDTPGIPDMPDFGDMSGFGWRMEMDADMGQGLIKELSLSKDQMDKIKKIRTDAQKKNIPLKGDLQLKSIEMRELIDSDSPDKDKIAVKIKEIDGIKTQMKINMTNAKIDVKGVLTKDQRDKLEQMRMERRMMPFMGKHKTMKKFRMEDKD